MTTKHTEDLFSADLFGDEFDEEITLEEKAEPQSKEQEKTAAVELTEDASVEEELQVTPDDQETQPEAEEMPAQIQSEETAEVVEDESAEEAAPAPLPLEARPVLSGDDGERLTLAHFAFSQHRIIGHATLAPLHNRCDAALGKKTVTSVSKKPGLVKEGPAQAKQSGKGAALPAGMVSGITRCSPPSRAPSRDRPQRRLRTRCRPPRGCRP